MLGMRYCPVCRAEYRAGFEACASCKGVALVDELPEEQLFTEADLPGALPVAVTRTRGMARTVEVEGRVIDLMRAFVYDDALEHRRALEENHIPAILLPLEVAFPDRRERFEVCVREKDHGNAENLLHDLWKAHADVEPGVEGSGELDTETCPACGGHVPLNVEECPDCGLVIGVGGASDAEEERAPG